MSRKADLVAEAESLGVEVDARWTVARLREEIADAQSDSGDPARDSREEPAPATEDMAPTSTTLDIDVDEDADAEPLPSADDVTGEQEHPGTGEPMHPIEGEVGGTPADDGWPRQVAPQAWVDQDGGRHTDLGRARAAAQAIRDRS